MISAFSFFNQGGRILCPRSAGCICRIFCKWWIKRKNLSWCGRGLNLWMRRFPRSWWDRTRGLSGTGRLCTIHGSPAEAAWFSLFQFTSSTKSHNNIISHHLTHSSLVVIFSHWGCSNSPASPLFPKRSLYIHYCLKLRLEMPSHHKLLFNPQTFPLIKSASRTFYKVRISKELCG